MTFDVSLAAQAFLTLLVIMDPLGNVPVFLALTAREDRATRRRTALPAGAAATVLIYVFAFFGTQILSYLSIGLPALQAGGGILLFLIALQMVSGDILVPEESEGVNVAIVPLGTPLVAGPGAIATVMVFMTGDDGLGLSASNQVTVLVAISAALAVVYLVLRYSSFLARLLKDNGIHLITRVFGMLLLAIAVQLVADAVRAFVTAG
jgi:multiple antibiotic resistance protein